MSIRISSFLFVSLFVCNLSFAQIYFNKRYDILNAGKASVSWEIIEHNPGYFVSFTSQPINIPYGGIGFLKLDSAGNVTGTILYEDNGNTLWTGYPGSFIPVAEDSLYACLGTKIHWVPEGRYDRGWLLMLDENLDTLWTKTYTDEAPHDTSIIFRNFRKLNDGGYIVVGLLNPVAGNGLYRIGMFRLDSNGNLLWKRKFGSGNVDFQPVDVSETSDHGFIIGAAYQPAGTPITQGSDAYLIKTDSSGISEWQLHLGNPDCHEEFAMVDTAIDGNILVGTEYSDTCWGWSEWKARINLVKIRNDKSNVWDKKYGFPKTLLTLSKIKTLPSGDIIATGWHRYSGTNFSRIVSWIIRTDSAGNEKWYREYRLLPGNNSDNYLRNVILTGNNGFAACGEVLPLSPDTGTQDSWVLKVDSLGCESPGNCWVGQQEIWFQEFTPQKPFVVYPNPVNEKLTIEFHTNTEGADIKLYTLCMQLIQSAKIDPDIETIELDVGHLMSGVYLLSVVLPQKAPILDKIIKR
ncbi:MAG: T9SS type A sorting domain-containing protein [Bacteroidales bacterium]|nr:T9SS type A sorting domain-containing protein [Bacteroidales bacterium]